MSGIHVYNRKNEEHCGDNVFYIGRGSVLGNPYTHIKDRETKASFICRDRDEAIDSYSMYFDTMYGRNIEFTKAVDRIYEAFRMGADVYLGCYCAPLRCHGDIIRDKLQKRLIKEKLKNIR